MKKMKHMFTFGALLGFTLGTCLSKSMSKSSKEESVGLEEIAELDADAENKFYQMSEKIQKMLSKLDYTRLQEVSNSLKTKIETKLQELSSLLA